MKLRTAIIDDEIHCLETLAYDLRENHEDRIQIIFTSRNGLEAIKLLNKFKPDLIFLDIEMAGLGGFDILEVLNDKTIKVVFTTAHSKYAVKAVGSQADAYLLKPILPEELKAVIGKVHEEIQASSKAASIKKLSIPNSNGIELIPYEEIIYCKSDDNYTTVFLCSGEKIVASKTLKYFGQLLPEGQFVRIHKSFIINLMHLKKYLKTDGGIVVMLKDIKLPVSRFQKENLLKLIQTGS
jgi:two-component system, LytTR family, response regulator